MKYSEYEYIQKNEERMCHKHFLQQDYYRIFVIKNAIDFFYFAYVNTQLFVLKSMFAKVFCKVLAYWGKVNLVLKAPLATTE